LVARCLPEGIPFQQATLRFASAVFRWRFQRLSEDRRTARRAWKHRSEDHASPVSFVALFRYPPT
jgi:hypothetical protein